MNRIALAAVLMTFTINSTAQAAPFTGKGHEECVGTLKYIHQSVPESQTASFRLETENGVVNRVWMRIGYDYWAHPGATALKMGTSEQNYPDIKYPGMVGAQTPSRITDGEVVFTTWSRNTWHLKLGSSEVAEDTSYGQRSWVGHMVCASSLAAAAADADAQ